MVGITVPVSFLSFQTFYKISKSFSPFLFFVKINYLEYGRTPIKKQFDFLYYRSNSYIC